MATDAVEHIRTAVWPARHPVVPFAVIVYAISWVCRRPLLADRQELVGCSASPPPTERCPPAAFSGFFLSMFAASPVLAWLYLRSHGSILVVARFHAVFDIATTTPTTTALIPTAMGAVITVAGWR